MELIGLLLPILISTINKKVSDSDVRFWVSVVVCVVVGLFVNWLQTLFVFATPLDGFNSITATIMVIFGLSQVSYKTVVAKDSMLKRML